MNSGVFKRVLAVLISGLLLCASVPAQLTFGEFGMRSVAAPTLQNRTRLSTGLVAGRPRLSFVGEYARFVRTIEGNRSVKARQACERAIDLQVLPLTQTQADFFYLGFAHYLLGNTETAKYFFDNSSGFSAEYYDQYPL